MAQKYVDSNGLFTVRTNHILNPDFEIDASHWAPFDTNATPNVSLEVVTGNQFHGGKALKVTATASNANGRPWGIRYTGPPISVGTAREGRTWGDMRLVAHVSKPTAGDSWVRPGFYRTRANGHVGGWSSDYYTPVGTTPTRATWDWWDNGGLANTDTILPYFQFDCFAETNPVWYIDGLMLLWTTGSEPQTMPQFVSGNRTNGVDGMNYAWTGTAHNSTSTGTTTRLVTMPETCAAGGTYTLSGTGFAANETVYVRAFPSDWDTNPDATDTKMQTVAGPDGTWTYSFTMPENYAGPNAEVRAAVYGTAYQVGMWADQVVNVTAGSAIQAQIFMGGTAKPIIAMQVVSAGALVPVTKAGG